MWLNRYAKLVAACTVLLIAAGGMVTSTGHVGCLWIDGSHVLALDAVITYPSGSVTQLPQGGRCGGRFPGGL